MSKRTRRTLFILTFIVGLSYFAFTVLFFDPFEGSYMDSYDEASVALEFAVPRNIDFFAHKRGLEGDFDEESFPVPNSWNQVRFSEGWQRFEETSAYEELTEVTSPGERIEAIREISSQIPLLDPLSDLLGTDAALFGRLEGRGVEATEVCAVFVGSGKTKLAYEAMRSDMLRSLLDVPADVEESDGGILAITTGDGRTLYLYRRQDFFAAGTGRQLVREVKDLIDQGREGSLGYTRRYHATVAQDVTEWAGLRRDAPNVAKERVEDRIQFHANLPSMFSLVEFDEAFLQSRGEMSRWILARIFNPRFFDSVTLDIELGPIVKLRGMLGFNRDLAESAGVGFYDRKTFELKPKMDAAAALLPEDTFFVMAARIDPRKFLPSLIKGLTETDSAAKELLDDVITSVRKTRPDFRATDGAEAAKNLAAILGQDVVIAMKRDTYYGQPENPMPIITIFFDVVDRGPTFLKLGQSYGNPAVSRGFNGFVYPLMKAHTRLTQDRRGVSKWYTVRHNQDTPQERFVHDILLTGTDIRDISFGIVDPKGKSKGPWKLALVLSPRVEMFAASDAKPEEVEEYGTANEMMTDIIQLSIKGTGEPSLAKDRYHGGTREVRSLLLSEKYNRGSAFLEGFASVALYLDAEGWKQTLKDRAQLVAEEVTRIDWAEATEQFEEDLLAGDYRKYQDREMSAAVRKKFEDRVEDLKKGLADHRRMVLIPEARRRIEQNLDWLDLFQDLFLASRIDEMEANIEVRARIHTNLDG